VAEIDSPPPRELQVAQPFVSATEVDMLAGQGRVTAECSRLESSGVAQSCREPWLWLAVLLVLGIYASRLTALTIRGEEPRWACVAQEMIATGDYIVPRLQGEPFPDRPPLNSWAMVVAAQLTGELDLVAIRLPSLLATVLTVAVIYLYARRYLSPGGAFAASACYATFGLILQLGRVAESDALLTLFLTCALLCWHAAYERRRDPRVAWLAGYVFAALAALCKGPQGPVYFVAITAAYLGLRRDWRFLFSRWHVAGLATFAAVVAAWLVPFAVKLGADSAWRVWMEGGHLSSRFQVASWSKAFSHWAEFPFEVFGSMLPWSFLLPVVFTRWFWRGVGEARPLATFVVTAFLVALPTCWLPTESRPRYLMSLYPMVALVVGLIVERSCQAEQTGWWPRSWDNYVVTGIWIVLIVPVGMIGVCYFGPARVRELLSQALPQSLLVGYFVAALVAAALAQWSRRRPLVARAALGMFALAAFWGASYTTIVINLQAQTSNDPSHQIADIRAMLPKDRPLVSFGRVHHLFAWYYDEAVTLEPLEENVAPVTSDAEYFCFSVDPGFPTPQIPFAWEQITEVSCERARSDKPLAKVIVGRRVREVALQPGESLVR
jgi:4-amino-4-deoxy-L-arabinose transferase-like glycosyltransferase